LSQKVERSLFEATICFVGKVDRLCRDLRHLVNTVHDLTARGIGFKVLTGHGASIDTTFPGGKLVFGIFAALSDFERELIIEWTKAGMTAARARGCNGGRPYKTAPSKLCLAVASMKQPETRIGNLGAEVGITLWMHRSIRPKNAAQRRYSAEQVRCSLVSWLRGAFLLSRHCQSLAVNDLKDASIFLRDFGEGNAALLPLWQ
jgi:Resolvase, N terminal domain